jgi:DNA-directed RNA polymerase subunit RPC12/RpoP
MAKTELVVMISHGAVTVESVKGARYKVAEVRGLDEIYHVIDKMAMELEHYKELVQMYKHSDKYDAETLRQAGITPPKEEKSVVPSNLVCASCGKEVMSSSVIAYSKEHFDGNVLCFNCQQKAKKNAKKNKENTCVDCGNTVTSPRVLAYAKEHYDAVVCFRCQQKRKATAKKQEAPKTNGGKEYTCVLCDTKFHSEHDLSNPVCSDCAATLQ